MPFLDTNGQTFHIQQLGSGEQVVFVHGMMESMGGWYYTLGVELAEKYSVLLYDLRGHGLSSKALSGYTINDMVSDLSAIINKLKLNNFILIGYSYGALISINYALKNSGQVNKLILIETPTPPADIKKLVISSNDNEGNIEFDEIFSALKIGSKFDIDNERSKSTLSRRAKKALDRRLFLTQGTSLFKDMLNEPIIPNLSLQSITMPTLLLNGENSNCLAVSEQLVNSISSSKLQLIQNCGHFIHKDAPKEMASIIMDYLNV